MPRTPRSASAPATGHAPQRRAAASGDRRTTIVEVAYRQIAERGLEGLRFADVAQGAGINNGTLLYYFANKDALIQAVGAYLVNLYSQSAAPPRADGQPPDPLEELRWEFTDARARLRDDAGIVYTELLARAQRDPAVAALLRGIDASWRNWLTGLIERGRAAGSLRADVDAELVATAIMASIRGVGMQALIDGHPYMVEHVMDALGEQIVAWIRA